MPAASSSSSGDCWRMSHCFASTLSWLAFQLGVRGALAPEKRPAYRRRRERPVAARRREHREEWPLLCERLGAGAAAHLRLEESEGVVEEEVGQVVVERRVAVLRGHAVVGDGAVVVAGVALEAMPVGPARRHPEARGVLGAGAVGTARQAVVVEVLARVGRDVAGVLQVHGKRALLGPGRPACVGAAVGSSVLECQAVLEVASGEV